MSRKNNPNPFAEKVAAVAQNALKTCDACKGYGKRSYLWLFATNCNKCKGTGKVKK